MISAELQKAIDGLEIQDVYLRDQIANCREDFDPKYDESISGLTIQTMHFVRQSAVLEIDENVRLLRVFIRLGVRWVDMDDNNEDASVKALIESEFVAEYSMKDQLDQASIDEFSLKNTSYHIWPYWRELLSSQCARMNLPRVILPTIQLADNRNQEVSNSLTGEINLGGGDSNLQ